MEGRTIDRRVGTPRRSRRRAHAPYMEPVSATRTRALAIAIWVFACAAAPADAFDSQLAYGSRPGVLPPPCLSAAATPSGVVVEEASQYRLDPLYYDKRFTSMFGSELALTDRLSIFADYQYDQWAQRSMSTETAFGAWKNYRVTLGWSFRY